MVLSLVLVGIPGMLFTNSIFVANMYGRLVKESRSSLKVGVRSYKFHNIVSARFSGMDILPF